MTTRTRPIHAESQLRVVIDGQRRVGGDVQLLRFRAPAIARAAQPGQFLHLRVPGATLLRRPFSIHDVIGDRVSVLYRLVGAGTLQLAGISTGGIVDVIGPLGRPFAIDPVPRHQIVVAGGIGIAPLQFLLRRLHHARLAPLLFYGCTTKHELLPHLAVKKVTTTDDGSCGSKGFVTSALQEWTATHPGARLYACGPWPMLRAVAQIAARHGLPCQVSLESLMACGIGACQGCVVKTVNGYRTVCHDGPVFDSADIDWSQEPVV